MLRFIYIHRDDIRCLHAGIQHAVENFLSSRYKLRKATYPRDTSIRGFVLQSCSGT